MSAALKQAAQLAQALRALANAASLHIDEAGCDCPFRMRDRGEHLAGCSHFDLSIEINAAFVTLAALEAAPQQEPGKLDAERYRWLRNEAWAGYNQGRGFPHVFTEDGAGNRRTMLAEAALDDAVDKARKAQP